MRGLSVALSTSGPVESVAVGLPDGAVGYHEAPVVRGAPRELTRAIERLLSDIDASWADVALWACDVGPGSFTGVRLGISVAQALAWAHGVPVVGVGAFEALARPVQDDEPLLLTLPARRSVHYVGLREVGGRWHEAEVADHQLQRWLVERLPERPPIGVAGTFRAPPRPVAGQPGNLSEALAGWTLRERRVTAGPAADDVLWCARERGTDGTDAAETPRAAPRYLGVPAAVRGATDGAPLIAPGDRGHQRTARTVAPASGG